MALTNAERRARYRERRQVGESGIGYRRPVDRRSRPQQWDDAVQTLLALQFNPGGPVAAPAAARGCATVEPPLSRGGAGAALLIAW